MQRIDSIIGGIAPSPYAGVGLNVIRAIASYAGKPVEARIAGSKPVGHAFIDACSYVIAPPGRLPLQPIRFSLVDVPDLQLLPDVWPSLRRVWMGAGPVPGILHRALNALAWAVRLKILPSLSPFAGLMYHITNIFRWGEHRGGMFVAVRGAGLKGEPIARSWHLVAEGDDGPYIPSMAAEAVIRRRLAGRTPPAGARSAISDLALSDYASLFARRRIYTGNRQERPVAPDVPLYRRLLGEAWNSLPEPLQRMHDFHSKQVAEGSAKVERGSGLCARLVAWLFGFPKTGENVPLRVSFEPRKGEETWQRDFADTTFISLQRAGTGRLAGLLDESFGPFAFGLALVVDEQILRLVARRWSFLGIPLPTVLIPRGDAYEFASDGRFNFHVEIRLPLVGLIVRYQGWLVPVAQTAYEAPIAKSGVMLEAR